MYRVTEIESGAMYPMYKLRYVRQGDNGWAQCEDDEESEFLSVPDIGICRICDDSMLFDSDSEYPFVKVIEDNGLLLSTLCTASEEHTVQLTDMETDRTDTQDGLCELADMVEDTAVELQDGLLEQADIVADLIARIEALEARIGE